MGYNAKKTEHCGAKRGRGAYWGHKKDAKLHSKKKRRAAAKKLENEFRGTGIDDEAVMRGP